MDNTAIERFYRLSESNQDDPEIQYQIALCYLNGEGIEQDGQMARELLQQAANQGHAEAKSLLNSLTGYGRSSAVSLTKETLPDWCLKAEDGDADAQYQVACWFMNSNSPGSAEESDRYLNMAIEQGHGPACLLLAKRYLQQDRATDAIQLLLNARDCGLTEATALLGQCYAEGIGTPKDPAKAEEFLIEAAEYSGGEAKLKLAVRYATGNGVPLMPGKALNWVKRAQDNGIEDAMEQYERLRSEYWLKIKEQEEQARLEVEAEKRREEEKVREAQEAKQKHQEEYERRLAEAREQDKAEALHFTKIWECGGF